MEMDAGAPSEFLTAFSKERRSYTKAGLQKDNLCVVAKKASASHILFNRVEITALLLQSTLKPPKIATLARKTKIPERIKAISRKKLIYLISRVFLAQTFFNFLAYYGPKSFFGPFSL